MFKVREKKDLWEAKQRGAINEVGLSFLSLYIHI